MSKITNKSLTIMAQKFLKQMIRNQEFLVIINNQDNEKYVDETINIMSSEWMNFDNKDIVIVDITPENITFEIINQGIDASKVKLVFIHDGDIIEVYAI